MTNIFSKNYENKILTIRILVMRKNYHKPSKYINEYVLKIMKENDH